MATLANFKDKFIFLSGGMPAGSIEMLSNGYDINSKVRMYDIKKDTWS